MKYTNTKKIMNVVLGGISMFALLVSVPTTASALTFINGGGSGATFNTSSAPRTSYNTSSAPRTSYNTSSAPSYRFNTSSAPSVRYNTSSAPSIRYNTSSAPSVRYNTSSAPSIRYNTSSAPSIRYNTSSAPAIRYNTSSAPSISYNTSSAPNITYGNSGSSIVTTNTSAPAVAAAPQVNYVSRPQTITTTGCGTCDGGYYGGSNGYYGSTGGGGYYGGGSTGGYYGGDYVSNRTTIDNSQRTNTNIDNSQRTTTNTTTNTKTINKKIVQSNPDPKTKDLQVICFPPVSTIDVDEKVWFQALVSGGHGSYDYDWYGDTEGKNSSDDELHVEYDRDGVYRVTIKVTDSEGNTDSDTCRVTVEEDDNDSGISITTTTENDFTSPNNPPQGELSSLNSVFLAQVPYTGPQDVMKFVGSIAGVLILVSLALVGMNRNRSRTKTVQRINAFKEQNKAAVRT